jgi:hypothetical protein
MSTNQDNPVTEELQTPIPARVPRPFLQFSLGTMFWIMTATAIVCAVVFRMPGEFAIPLILLIGVALPAVLTTVIIYGRSYQRTFCIGAMFPSAFFLFMVPYGGMGMFPWGSPSGDDIVFRMVVCGFWASSLLIGGVCVGVRRLVEKQPA